MVATLSKLSLEQLRLKVATGPTPAGVAVAAISASLALSLVAMTVEVTARKKSSASGDRAGLRNLLRTAKRSSSQMLTYADLDVAAFEAYLKSRRSRTAAKLLKRAREAALARAIQTPLKIARAAAAGLELCAQAAPLVHSAVAADLAAAAAILEAAVRAAARSAESNLRYLPPGGAVCNRVIAERRLVERRAASRVGQILETLTD
ncbi:MAG TPA: cyclodeaminase/cyclohydrolase family protein [Candidatus Binataceae bacterium]|nr:cyclodeaminase/cyclohydrolase family protein [Candidatus Binataceae bacterium]